MRYRWGGAGDLARSSRLPSVGGRLTSSPVKTLATGD